MSDNIVDLSEARRKRSTVSEAEFRPSITFSNQDRNFVLGFEAGLLVGRLDAHPDSWRGTYHTDNLEDIQRVASAFGYDLVTAPSGDPTWVFCDFVRTST